MQANSQSRFRFAVAAAGLAVAFLSSSPVSAKHVDVLMQGVSGQVTTGSADFDASQWVMGQRVYNEQMEATSLFGVNYFSTNAPGFNSRVGDRPAGTDALPGSTDIAWDFLPVYAGGIRSDLLYWDGLGAVDFGAPSNARLNLAGVDSNETMSIFAEGSSDRTTGAVFARTGSGGFVHDHQDFSLFDDDFSGTAPEGVYVAAMELQIAPLAASEPILMVFSTPAISDTALADAAAWVEARVDLLSYGGDFNGDGVIDALDFDLLAADSGSSDPFYDLDNNGVSEFAVSTGGVSSDSDFLVRTILGTQYGDANLDGEVTSIDFSALSANFGQSGVGWVGGDFNGDGVASSADFSVMASNFGFGSAAVAVPEPTTAGIVAAGLLFYRGRRKR